jgi:hypothetical protein
MDMKKLNQIVLKMKTENQKYVEVDNMKIKIFNVVPPKIKMGIGGN